LVLFANEIKNPGYYPGFLFLRETKEKKRVEIQKTG